MKTISDRLKTAAALFILLTAPASFSSCDGTGGGALILPNRTWVAIDPVQCLQNPWELDWLASHANDYLAYPREIDSQLIIIRLYYAGLGVDVDEALSIPNGLGVCDACSCPRGDTIYLHVRDRDLRTMLILGFRVEAPYNPGPGDTSIVGMYRYTGYDSLGAVLITGTLEFKSVDSTSARGTWELDGPEGYGPQIGVGTFEGWIDGGVVTLNLNPGWADNNVFLYGRMAAGVYSGQWDWVTFIGPTYTGSFTAVKMEVVPPPTLPEGL